MVGGLREGGELGDPGACLVAGVGPYGRLDAVHGGHPLQGGHAERAQVVQCCGRIPSGGGPGALGPSGQVVDRVGEDAQRVLGHDLLGLGQVVLVVVAAGQGGKQGEPRQGGGGEGGLSDAARQGQRLVGAAADRGPRTGGELGEGETFQAVDDHHAGAELASGGHHRGVVAPGTLVVAQVERCVAEVPHDVQVLDLPSCLKGLVEGGGRASPVALGRGGERAQQEAKAGRAGGVGIGRFEQVAPSPRREGVAPLSPPKVRVSAAADAISRARPWSRSATARAPTVKMR